MIFFLILICCVFSGGIGPCLAGICCCCCSGLAAAAATSNNTTEEVKSFRREEQHDYHYNTFHQSSPPLSAYDRNPEFEECARRAKSEVENAPTTTEQQSVQPYSGLYKTSYVDRTTGTHHEATLNLHFTPDFHGRGYKISGEGNDIDGNTVIEDGHANPNGMAWWRERTVTKDVGLIVLSRGKFDFSQRSFKGSWIASTMEQAAYIIFEAADNNDGMYNDVIPEATAVQVFSDQDTSPFAPAVPVTPSAPLEPPSPYAPAVRLTPSAPLEPKL